MNYMWKCVILNVRFRLERMMAMYSRTEKSDFVASWIAAPSTLQERLACLQAQAFPNAKYIWGRDYVRQHLCRVFAIEGGISSALMQLACDNVIDVFLNGSCVASRVKSFSSEDVARYLKPGKNLLWIRTYQTATPDRFTSALIGGLRLTYANGDVQEVVTDENFVYKRLVDFWVTEEPKGWEASESDARELPLIVSARHPIAIKRSCYFRTTFSCSRTIKSAWLYGSAQGCYEPYLNGVRVTDAQFMPSSSDSAKEYQRFNVTALLKKGKNTLGAITGNGWYNCAAYGRLFANLPSVLLQLEIEYEDGTVETVKTDRTWQVAPSPLTDNDLQYGERYDARLEIPNWCEPQGDGYAWDYAEVLDPAPHTTLLEQNYPPVRPVKTHTCRYLGEIEPGVWLYDIGINIAGCVQITLREPARGERIFLQCCERLRADGSPEIGAYGAVFYQQDTLPDGISPWCLRNLNLYTAKGDAMETYVARFAYTGFRYVYVSGMKERPREEDLCAIEIHNDLEAIGSFSSADESLNRLWSAAVQTWYNNCYNGPTDCPTREKNFWNGDAQIFSHAACWISDASDFLARWTDVGRKMQPGPYGWEDEDYVIPWTLYRFFGDEEILRVKYPVMLALIEKRQEFEGMILPEHPHSPYNDWLNPTGENLSKEFFSGCWYLHMLDIVSRVADVLGDAETRDALRARFEAGCLEFNRRHYDLTCAEYDEKIQSALVLPLAFEILPEAERQRAGDSLNRYVEKNGYALTTGFQATRYLPEVLTRTGHLDTVVKLFRRDAFPSWNFIFQTGATNVTESWFGMADPDASISMSHFSLGSIVSFFFEYLGGIAVEECAPGFSHVVLKPHFHETIGAVSIRYRTPHGEIVSEWHYENGTPVWHYEVPDGVTVEVKV